MTLSATDLTHESAGQSSLSNLLRSKGLAILLTLATPTSMLSLTGCSPRGNETTGPQKPEYSSLVVSNSSTGMPLAKVASHLVSLGEVHGPVQDALVATIAFGETSGLGDPSTVNGNTATVVTLKNALQSAHRALTNAGNSSDFTAIKGQVDTVSGSIAELMNTVSSQPQFEIYWNNASHNADDQMQGVPVALKAQEQMEKLVGALDEDMAALVPGFQLSRIVQFAETLGSARTAVEAVGESLKSSERDAAKVGELKKQLADSMSRVEAISKEPELTKLAAGTDTVVTSMSALYTGLAEGLAVETLTALQGKASAALNDLKVVEGEVKKELEHRHYSGSTFVYFPHMYHWHSTGMISPYSSWGGASGFASTSRFSSGASASAGDATHAGLTKGARPTAVKSLGGFKGSSFAKPGASSGFKSGGFGKTGSSFGGHGAS